MSHHKILWSAEVGKLDNAQQKFIKKLDSTVEQITQDVPHGAFINELMDLYCN